jgi:ATP:ADP antiporter, AAA family
MLTTLEKVDLLQHVHIFREIPTESLLRIATVTTEVRLEDRQVLFSENSPADAMFVLLKGEITLTQAGREEQRLARFEVAGAFALLAERTQAERAGVRGPTVALKIGREDFYEAMTEDINITRGIMRALVGLLTP